MSRRTDLWKGNEGPDVPTGGVTEAHLGSHAKWRGNPTQLNPSLAAEGGLSCVRQRIVLLSCFEDARGSYLRKKS